MNSKTFATVQAYKTAKGSTGEITVALAATNSASFVSYITELNKTVVDAVNVLVDEPYGEIGDTLLWDSTLSKYMWLKSRVSTSDSRYVNSLGGMWYRAAGLSSTRYTIIGTLVHRVKNDGLIMSDDLGGMPWCLCADGSTYAISFTNMPNDKYNVSTRRSVSRPGWCSSIGLAFRERLGDASYNQYSNPFPRKAAWDRMMLAFQSGEAKSGKGSSSSPYYTETTGSSYYTATPDTTVGWSWKTEKTNNIMTATFSFNMGGQNTNNQLNPAEFDYKFDKFYKECIEVDNTMSQGTVIGELSEGKDATRRMVDFITAYNADSSHASNKINATATTNAAICCDSRNVTTTDNQFVSHRWWLPSMRELTYATKADAQLYKKGTNLPAEQYIWTSSQYSQYYAWSVRSHASYCVTNCDYKYGGFRVRAFAAYHFPKP